MECRRLPGNPSVSSINLLESDRLDGDWKIISYMMEFGTRAYFVNIPSEFIAADGVTMWLLYSGNFSLDPEGKPYPRESAGRPLWHHLAEDRIAAEVNHGSR